MTLPQIVPFVVKMPPECWQNQKNIFRGLSKPFSQKIVCFILTAVVDKLFYFEINSLFYF